MVSRLLGGIEPMPVKNDTYFRHLKPGEKDYKQSDSGGLFMLVTKTGSKLWRYAYNFDSKQKLLALGQYPVTSLADARIKRDDAKTPNGRTDCRQIVRPTRLLWLALAPHGLRNRLQARSKL